MQWHSIYIKRGWGGCQGISELKPLCGCVWFWHLHARHKDSPSWHRHQWYTCHDMQSSNHCSLSLSLSSQDQTLPGVSPWKLHSHTGERKSEVEGYRKSDIESRVKDNCGERNKRDEVGNLVSENSMRGRGTRIEGSKGKDKKDNRYTCWLIESDRDIEIEND